MRATFKSFTVSLILVLLAGSAFAQELVEKRSAHSVQVTVDKLSDIVTEKGFKVIARVDHSAAAIAAGLSLPPTQLLIFGNPKVGTQLMTSERTVGLDLPIRVLVWEDEEGGVWLTYTEPAALLARHGIGDRDAIRQKMTAALNAFTDGATQ